MFSDASMCHGWGSHHYHCWWNFQALCLLSWGAIIALKPTAVMAQSLKWSSWGTVSGTTPGCIRIERSQSGDQRSTSRPLIKRSTFSPDSTTVDSTRYSWILYTKLTLESFAFDPNFQQLPHWSWLVRWMVNLSEHKDPHPLGIRINGAPWSQPESITAAASSRVGIPNALNRSICTVVSVSSENIISICAPGMAFLSQSM